jgi:hypothetical protein
VVLPGSEGLQARSDAEAGQDDACALRSDLHPEDRLHLSRQAASSPAAHKDELLRVLDRPEIPLHTNGSDNDIRSVVTKRKVSGGTVSDAGKTARDTLLGLMKTCAKLNVSFYQFLGDRLGVPDAANVPPLPDHVRLRPHSPGICPGYLKRALTL